MGSTDREVQVEQQDAQKEPGASQAQCLLLVDDNFAVRSSLKTWLANVFPQFKILEADSGESALALFDFVSPILVLMDIALPGMKGIEAVRRIKTLQPDTKIVMWSIHDEPQYQNDAYNAGATAFFSKSGAPKDLLPILKDLLEVDGEP